MSFMIYFLCICAFLCVVCWVQLDMLQTQSEYSMRTSKIEYERWRLRMILDGFPAPKTWDELEKEAED